MPEWVKYPKGKVPQGYNADMNSATIARLREINREFYDRFGAQFSATRQRLQPGVKKILNALQGDESILDLGCGNGELARELTKRGHRGAYLGVDFSRSLLREAQSIPGVSFREVDLAQLSAFRGQLIAPVASSESAAGWALITAFAVLQHIPSHEMRLEILRTARQLLKEDGQFVLSNWQFLNSEKLKARVHPWSKVGLSAEDVDEGDYLLDWRSGGESLRYVHHFSAEELHQLAAQAGMRVTESFPSDGENRRLGLYQVWKSR